MDNMSEDNLMVTIRCITYNHAKYIRQCLDGFIMQKTKFRFEVFVHDDASTDGTDLIIKEYAEKYPELIKPYFETENQYSKHDGSFQRITNDPRYLKGKYIALCEGDDYWIDPFKLQKQVDIIESDPQITMVCNRTQFYSEKKRRILSEYYCKTNKNCLVDTKDVINRNGLYISTCSILYRKEVRDSYPLYCENCAVGDYPLQIMCALKGDIYYIDKPLSVYRIDNPNSWAGREKWGTVDDSRLKTILSMITMLKGFAEDYPRYKRIFMDNIGYQLLFNIPQKRNVADYQKYTSYFNEYLNCLPIKWRIVLWLRDKRKPIRYIYYLYTRFIYNKYIPLKYDISS